MNSFNKKKLSMEKIFYCSIDDIIRLLISSAIIYLLIIIYIRFLGKRSTSELNNFDWIVTVSVGSIVASTIIIENVSVTEGGCSVLFLMILQYIVTQLMYKSSTAREIVKSTPQLLLFEGKFLEKNLEKERIPKPEVYAAIRQRGLKSIKQIYAIVLETNSKISVIPNENCKEIGFSLSDVQGLPSGLKEDLKKYNDE